jgi:hypothetical protein
LARIDSADEQIALWENMKRGEIRTVRSARASKKRTSSSRQSQHPGESALKAGEGFIRQLRKVAIDQIPAGGEVIAKLLDLQNQINDILQEVSTQLSSTDFQSENQQHNSE